MTEEIRHDALFRPGQLRVKICGVTNPEDAAIAIDAGADAIGINLFRGSKRFVELDAVAAWVRELPVTRVAVVVNASKELLARVVTSGCFDIVQFHGDELPDVCSQCLLPWMRAVRVADETSLVGALEYDANALLLDGFSSTAYGGTGVTVDPVLARDFVAKHPERRVILAGGLTPKNVAAAAATVRPHGVDVAGGVERRDDPRRKDAAAMRDFIAAARGS